MFFKKRKRGIINVEARGGGLLSKETKYNGSYEVEILEETEDMYKIRYKNKIFQRSDVVPKWVQKDEIKLINL